MILARFTEYWQEDTSELRSGTGAAFDLQCRTDDTGAVIHDARKVGTMFGREEGAPEICDHRLQEGFLKRSGIVNGATSEYSIPLTRCP